MDFDFSSLFSSFLIGTIGLGFFMYGKKASAPLPLGVGLAMMIYPYVIANLMVMWAIAAVLFVVPFIPYIMSRRGV